MHPFSLSAMISIKHTDVRATSMIPLLLAASVTLSFAPKAFAALPPPLGAATSYAILGSTFTNTTAGTLVTGDIGFTTGPAVPPAGVHNNYGPGAPYALAGSDQNTALSVLAAEPCTFTFPAGAVNLSTDTTHGPVGVYTPGVYCGSGAMNIGGPLTLSCNGTFVFRTSGALTSTAGAIVALSGASACNVFWTPGQATTLAANTTMAGTVIANAGITVGANVTWSGRALAFGGTVTTDTVTIALCATVVPTSSAQSSASVSSTVSSSSSLSSSSFSQANSSLQSSSAPRSSIRSVVSSRSRRSSRRTAFPEPVILALVENPPPPPDVPLLPNTGIGEQGTDMPWLPIAAGVFVALTFLGTIILEQRLSSKR